MSLLNVTFDIPGQIANGLANHTLERVGGVIRAVGSKQVVAWLREFTTSGLPLAPSPIPVSVDPVTGILNLFVSGANLGVSIKGFSDVKQRLGGIDQQLGQFDQRLAGVEQTLGHLGQNLQQMQGILQITSAASILNLGVSAIGFAVVVKHLNEIESQLQEIQKTLNKIDVKLDLRYYAEFRAALKTAAAALTMKDAENRKKMAIHAIDGLTKAEQYYLPLADIELEQRDLEKRSKVIEEYLFTLMLCYITEARCYLELLEPALALQRLQEGELALQPRIQKYVQLLLTSNPAAYLHPSLKDKVDLRRLTKVYQWISPELELDEVSVFEMHRENLISLVEKSDYWVKSLSLAIFDWTQVPWGIAYNDALKKEAYKALPGAMDTIESMVETYDRFQSYQTEVKAIAQLGISFHDWLQLAPQEAQPEGSNLMYIIPAEPLSL